MRPPTPTKRLPPCRATAKPTPVSPALRDACERRVRIYRGLMSAGFTGEEAAYLVGHVTSTLWKWEQGRFAASYHTRSMVMRRFSRLRRRVERLEMILARLRVRP